MLHFGERLCPPDDLCGPMVRGLYLLHYVIEGKGEFWNETRRYAIGPGDVFAIYPDELVAYQADAKEPWRFCWVGFRGRRAAECYERIGVTHDAPVFHFAQSTFRDVIQRCLRYTEENLNQLSRLRLTGFLCEALACLEKPQPEDGSTAARRCVSAAAMYMKEHLGQRLFVSEVARHVGFEHSYFYRIFKKETGVTPERYLMMLRVENAKELIRRGYSFKEAATLSSFSNVYYFSRLFRQLVGVTPSEYRRGLSVDGTKLR